MSWFKFQPNRMTEPVPFLCLTSDEARAIWGITFQNNVEELGSDYYFINAVCGKDLKSLMDIILIIPFVKDGSVCRMEI